MNIKIVNELDKQTWAAFVEQHPHGNIFHTPEMFQVFETTPGYQPMLWAAVDDNNAVLALFCPIQISLFNGILRFLTTRSVSYGGVLAQPGPHGETALKQLLSVYNRQIKKQALFTELRNLHDVSTLQSALTSQNFTFEAHLNYLIDLNRPAEDVLQSFGRRTRKKIRKGLRDAIVHVSEVNDFADLSEWYRVLGLTYSQAQVPLADQSMFEAVFKILHPKGMAKFLIATIDEQIAACSVELLYKDIIYGWYGGLDRAHSQAYPNEMLMWHILEWGANNGYATYDFGGAGKPDEEYGVRDYKAKFRGELVNFGRNINIHNPAWFKLSQWGYQVYRKLL